MSSPNSKRIVYLQYTNPAAYPPIIHSSTILAEQGWKVLLLGTHSGGSNALVGTPHENIETRLMNYCAPGWKQKIHYLLFCLWCYFWTLRWRPDWIYASDLWSCFPALLLRRLFSVPFIYHEHDAPVNIGGQPGGTHPSAFLRFCAWARRKSAQAAKLCVIPNDERAKLFAAETGTDRPIHVVWNCPRLNEISAPREPLPGGPLHLLYHGSIVPERLPLAVIHALRKVNLPVVLHVVGYETAGSRGHVALLEGTARDLGIPERLHIVGQLPLRQSLMEFCSSCDAGLALLPASQQDINLVHMAGASNKVFDYMSRGLAVIVPPGSPWRELFVEPGYGLVCDPSDATSVAQAIGYLCEHPIETRSMGERGRQRILRDWNYESQFERVHAVLTGGAISGVSGANPDESANRHRLALR